MNKYQEAMKIINDYPSDIPIEAKKIVEELINEYEVYKKSFKLVLNQLSKYEYSDVNWLEQARNELEESEKQQMEEIKYYVYENKRLVAIFMNPKDIGNFIEGYLNNNYGYKLIITTETLEERGKQ